MIIHSPIVSGSLTFANGATFTLPTGGVYSGSFSGSYQGASFAGGTFTGNGSGLTFGGTGIVSGSSQLTTEFDARYLNTSGDGIVSSSAQVTELLPTGVVSGSSQIVSILSPLNTFSASEESKNSTLASYTGSVDTKNSTLGTYTASLETKNSTLATYTGSIDSKNSTLATYTGSVDTTLTNLATKNSTLETYTASLETKNSTLATYTGSVDTKNNTLGTYTASLETKNSTLASVTGSLLSSQTNLNTYTGSLLNAFQVTGSKINFLGDVTIYGTQSVINSQNVQIADNILYLSPTASVDNDLGIVGHYNDGTYRHAGIFMDASDGHAWKVFNSLQDETIGTVNTSGTGFALADFKAGVITGTSFTGTINSTNGVVSGSSQIAFSGVTGTVSNAQLANSTISGIALGSNLATLTIGTGLSGTSYNGSSAVTIANTGVTSNVAGTGVTVSGATGAVTISIGQSVATSANAQFNSLGIGMAASATAGRIDATNDIVAYSSSDIRFKENIKPIENPLEKISKISGNTYDWKEENKIEHGYEGNDVGVIAQEIEEVLPQLVQTRESGYKAVKYDKLVALLIEGIKEQQSQIEELKNKIEKLENGK